MILNHTKDGQPLTNELRQQMILDDVTKAHKLIEQHTGKKTASLAYPYGAYDTFAERAIKQAGYSIDYSTEAGSYSIKTIIVKQDGSKEVYWLNFKR